MTFSKLTFNPYLGSTITNYECYYEGDSHVAAAVVAAGAAAAAAAAVASLAAEKNYCIIFKQV